MSTQKHTLHVSPINTASARFKDDTGKTIFTRKSDREYVTATVSGSSFYGRLDLVGKNGHPGPFAFLARFYVKKVDGLFEIWRRERPGHEATRISTTGSELLANGECARYNANHSDDI